VFEKHWDYLPWLYQHPGFTEESPYCPYHMALFSHALSEMLRAFFLQARRMPNEDTFEPRPSAEAKHSDIEISEHAGMSRLLPIQDGLAYWQDHRSSAATGSGGSVPG
jgi:hypothetical protein